ncbi:MAG: hypothetical protein JW940_18260 [Polyangiaceae bacterium]|nr:hypothetical protein [Polyangiaceae bacterium]
MANRHFATEAELVCRERRQRENDAPRLREEVRQLASLAIEIDEYRGAGTFLAARYTRRIVLEHAPALFEIPCTEERCKGGGYDLTYQIMRALKAGRTLFDGQEACPGQLGSAECGRTLRYTVRASYAGELADVDRARSIQQLPSRKS